MVRSRTVAATMAMICQLMYVPMPALDYDGTHYDTRWVARS